VIVFGQDARPSPRLCSTSPRKDEQLKVSGEQRAATVATGSGLATPAGLAFIYTGNGSQWAGMGKRLLSEEPVFRAAVREVDALFRGHAAYSLEDELAGVNGEENRYERTEIAQPALFAMQVGITRMLAQRGSRRPSSPATVSVKWLPPGHQAR
jgi:phthiocerol/phenolphthiocerol synthesis type-I polyketide synthase C